MKPLLMLGGVVLTTLGLLLLLQTVSPKAGQAEHTLATVGIDPVSSGNTATSLATIDDCGAVPVGGTSTIDVYIGDDPRFFNDTDVHNLGTFGATFLYNPLLFTVTAIEAEGLFLGSEPFVAANDLPDTDGEFDFVVIDLDSPGSSGTAVVARITLAGQGMAITTVTLDNITLFDGGDPPLAFVPTPQSPVPADIAAGGLGNCNDFDSDGWCDPGLPSTTDHPCDLGLNDNCPLIANPDQTNTDAALEFGYQAGDACDPDDDGDGYWDDYESFRGSDPLAIASRPEICDGLDNDLDGTADEGFPDTVPGGVKDCLDPSVDTDSDGLNNDVDPDDDDDAFTDADENVITTNSLLRCATPTFTNTFPPDINFAAPFTVVDSQDMVAFLPSLFSTSGQLMFDRRKDIHVDGVIDSQDLVAQSTWLFIAC